MTVILAEAVVAGFLLLRVCSGSEMRDDTTLWIDPMDISVIFHTDDTPKGCSKILLDNGKTIFVYGSEQVVGEARNKALAERARLERPGHE